MTKAELEKRVAELETELAWRRNHICPQPYVPMAAGTCTCGTRRDLTYPAPCPVHGLPMQVFTTTLRPGQNVCGGAGGAAGYSPAQDFTVVTAGVPPNTHGCAGGGASHIYTIPGR